jgi:hypothetical protein
MPWDPPVGVCQQCDGAIDWVPQGDVIVLGTR